MLITGKEKGIIMHSLKEVTLAKDLMPTKGVLCPLPHNIKRGFLV